VRPKARTLFSVCENSVQAIESIEAAILQPVGEN
jgi:hypothetical protein